ncbi:MAG: diguanylate cyclase [Pseudomonadota bacterium]
MILFAVSGPLLLGIATAGNWLSLEGALPPDALLFRAGVVVSFLVLGGIALLYVDRHANALRSIVEVTERIRSGDLGARADVKKHSDTSELALAVNRMADELVGALRDVERERTAVLGAVVESVVEIDKNGQILAVNPATEALFGWSAADLLGANLKMILPSVDTARHGAADTSAGGRSMQARHREGQLFPVNLSLARRSFHGKPRFVGVITDQSEQRSYIQRLEELAFFDPLTKIPARRLVQDRLETALRRAQRNETRFAVLFIDINQFKPINDRYGHAVGDMVLAVLAQRLVRVSRDSDTVGRYGGDEFVVVAETISDQQDAVRLIDRYRSAICKGVPTSDRVLHVTASIGAACYPVDADNPEALLRIADERMYDIKDTAGRHGVAEHRR